MDWIKRARAEAQQGLSVPMITLRVFGHPINSGEPSPILEFKKRMSQVSQLLKAPYPSTLNVKEFLKGTAKWIK